MNTILVIMPYIIGIIIFSFLIDIIIIIILPKKIRNINYGNIYNCYTRKDYILTTTEFEFYVLLRNITNKLGLTVFTQVALYELVNCNKYNYMAFNKIKSKTIDFVITDKIRTPLLRVPVKKYYDMKEIENEIIRIVKGTISNSHI